MKQYNIKGMSCAACSARVEKAVSKVSGVTSCSVNLLTNSMSVEGSAADSDIIKAVKNAGYGASSIKNKEKAPKSSDFGAFGGDKRDRTADLLNAIQALSQLSYTPTGTRFSNRREL